MSETTDAAAAPAQSWTDPSRQAQPQPAQSRPLWSITGGCDLPWLAEVGALALRVYFGFVICWSAGVSKFPLDAWFAGQVEGLGFPMPTLFAWLAAMSEVAGGMLLVLGLATRPAAFFLAFTLGVAAFVFHKIPVLSVFTTQHITLKYFWVYVFFTFAGAGRLSLDGVMRNRQALAGALAAAGVVGLAIACGMREAPPQQPAPAIEDAERVTIGGSFNNWSESATPLTRGDAGEWSAVITADAAGPIEFKFIADENWSLSAGETDQPDDRFPVAGTAEPGQQAGNIRAYLPEAGEYRVSVSLPGLAYRLEAVAPAEAEPRPELEAAPEATE